MSAESLAVVATCVVVAVVCLAAAGVAFQVRASVRLRAAVPGAALPGRLRREADDDAADACDRAFAKTAWTRLGGGH
ncbi:hypothetical protein [Amnibacterium kyonggiense]|uniref:Uncharacterized protein n=1 Tax=Amnibacterium kyonggiense TaxID=595671 RepID=A0A4R7FKM9_9MICO|nr:hypothetical protein [Amnibacterium kyonggiense]TDS76905.1 hypothetical protein CLV52_1844 [Amnibacterium kyonggiense]